MVNNSALTLVESPAAAGFHDHGRDWWPVPCGCETHDGLCYYKRRCVRFLTKPFTKSHPKMASRDYVPLVNQFGVYFQIRDDYMNLQSPEVSMHVYAH